MVRRLCSTTGLALRTTRTRRRASCPSSGRTSTPAWTRRSDAKWRRSAALVDSASSTSPCPVGWGQFLGTILPGFIQLPHSTIAKMRMLFILYFCATISTGYYFFK